MRTTGRRAILGGTAAVAVGTVAAAWLLRKPAPEVHVLTPGGEPSVALQGPSALVVIEPARPMEPLSFVDDSGAQRTLADFAGRGVVLNLWATWCVPCVAELPALAQLAQAAAPDGIVVLPLSSDRGGAEVVRRFYASHAIRGLDVWLDPRGAVGLALAARGVPTTVIVDRQGRERARLEGAADWAAPEMLAAIRKLVG